MKLSKAANLLVGAGALALLGAGSASAQFRFQGAECVTPPASHCPKTGCLANSLITAQGTVLEPKTGRYYFLDYPRDLKPNEKVVFVLSIHGGGSYGNWHRHYFPLVDVKDKYRLVIATPNSPGGNWRGDVDDPYLHNIVDSVIGQIGRQNIKSFWLAGHSAGSAAARRIVCDNYFKTKVDGMVATSGGRISPVPARSNNPTAAPTAGRPGAGAPGRGGGAPGAGRGGAAGAPARANAGPGGGGLPTCDFSFIYTIGSNEIGGPIPEKSDWADRYGCSARTHREITDARGGYVYDTSARNTPVQLYRGGPPEGGVTDVYAYPGCRDGRVVADFLRRNKGHTQGHEPKVTEEIVKLMVGASGGKIARGG